MIVERGALARAHAFEGRSPRPFRANGDRATTESDTPDDPLDARHGDADELLSLAFEAGRLGSWRWDKASGRVRWDERLSEIFGFGPNEFAGTYDAYAARLHPDERAAVEAEISRALVDRRTYRLEHRIVWPDGTVRWVEGVGQVSVDESGGVTGTYGCVADVTDRVVAEADRAGVLERLEFLTKVGGVLNRSLDVEETFARVVSLVVPRLADAAVLFAVDDSGPRLVAARHADPARDQLLVELSLRSPLTPDQPGVGAAFATGEIQLLHDVPDELLQAVATDTTHLSKLRQLQVGAGIAVPLAIEGRVLGVLGLGMQHGRRVTDETVQTATALASRAAIALENSRLHSTVKTIADALQSALAPALPAALPDMRVAARYVAAGSGVEVGGDFYDLVDCGDGRQLLVIGDVCGRGPGAAALNAQVRFAARALARTGLDVGQVTTGLNANVVADSEDERFCTAVIAALAPDDRGITVELVAAGHPEPILVRPDGAVSVCHGNNPLLGVLAEVTFTPTRVHLTRGDVLVLVTDGVLEARSPHGEFFGEGRLHDAARRSTRTAAGVADSIHAAVASFAHRLADDLAIVAVQAT